MRIDRNNYELFFIDYLDGNLPLDKIDEMLDFLKTNEDLAEELKGLEHIKLAAPENTSYKFTGLLKEDLDMPEFFEEDCIRSLEGELTPLDKDIFTYRIKSDPQSKATYELYKATVSEPDLLIAYPNKESLKKGVKSYRLAFWYASAAVILMGLFLFIRDDGSKKYNAGADIAEVVIGNNSENKVTVNALKSSNIDVFKEEIKPYIPKVKSINVEKALVTEKEFEKTEQVLTVVQEPLALLESVKVNLVNQIIQDNQYALAKINVPSDKVDIGAQKYLTIGEFLSQQIANFTSKENVNKIRNKVLESIKVNTEEKFTYSTTADGGIKSLEYQSRVLAFSIPLSSKGKN